MINKTPTIVKKAEKSSTMKKLLFFLLVLTGMVQKAWADTTVTTESDLKSAVQTSQTVTLGQDITLTTTGRLDINGTTVTLDLNGHTLKRPMAAADAGGQVIAVKDGGKLTISDSSGNNSGKITGGWAYQGGAIYVYEGCSLTINGGTISGNRSDKIEGEGTNYGYGGGVENHGTMTMTGGKITGNTAGQFGGGIHNEGTLTITGGTITDNTAGTYGGAIYSNSTVSISGVTISGNSAQQGGGAISSEGETSLSNVTITGNRTNQYGGGIYLFGTGTVQMSGDCTITGNIAQAGGGIFHVSKGASVAGPTLKMQDKPVVDNNSPNDVYLQSYQLITVTGAFTEGARIGVDTEIVQDVFTTGYGKYHEWGMTNPDKFFFVSNPVLNGTIGTKTTDNTSEAYLTHTTYKAIKYIERSWDNEAKKVADEEKTCTSYTPISGNDTGDNGWFGLDNGWYVVTGNSSYKTLNVTGTDAHLIIPDGATLTVTGGVKVEQGHKLTIYGQTHDTGRLIANSSAYESAAGIGSGMNARAGDVTIHGGTIQATGNVGSAGIGTGGPPQRHHVKNGGGTVVIYGGNVTATGGGGGAGIGGGAELDLGSTFHFYMYGGTVTAQGGRYGGAGIGGGGNGGGAYGKVEGSTVDIYGGTLTATGGYDNYSHLSGAGIGGGDGGDSGMKVHIHGGTVTAQCGSFDGDGKRAIGPGDGGDDYGELTIADDLMVSAGYSVADSAPFDAGLRVSGCWYRPYAVIAPCTHPNPTYTVSGTLESDTHTRHCNHCLTTFSPETHTFGSDHKCSVCGVENDICIVTVNVPANNGATDGVYEAVTYQMVPGTTFKLPASPITFDDRVFAGWLVGEAQNNSYTTRDGEQLLAAGEEYTVDADVTFTARYSYIYITLANNADNSETLGKYAGKKARLVTLKDRTLYKDGSWNTLCLPFDLSDFTGTPLEGATVKTLTSAKFANGTLTLNFSEDLTAIEAGKPYIVKWASTQGSNNNTFIQFPWVTINNTITNVETDVVSFNGIFSPYTIEGEDRTLLYLGAGNKLYYPDAAMTIGSCRAYFQLQGGLTAGDPATPNAISAFKLNFGDDESTGITTTNYTNPSDAWYTIDGQLLNGKPTQKGIYINNGKKVVISLKP